jgi:hypothetical protein
MSPLPAQRVDRALLIGVDRYQYISPNLSGCVGDVEGLARLLAAKLYTPADHIIKLTAGLAAREKPAELATRDNIVNALKQLARASRPGEQVYVHYSGHGMRNDYTLLPGYEADGRDEAIAPADTGYQDPARFYLLDKELGWLIRQIADSGAFVTVVLDCCHSASGTRNLEAEVSVRHGRSRPEDVAAGRAWEGGDPRPRPDNTLVAPLAELKKLVAAAPGSSGALLAAPKNYVLLTACRERETAKEYKGNGLFTYYLLDLLGKGFANLTYRSLQDQVAGDIVRLASADRRYAEQTPQLEGDGNLILFGGAARSEPQALLANPQADGTLLLSGGAAVGIVIGTTVALYPPGAADLSPGGALGLATVTEVRVDASVARAAKGIPAGRLVPGMRAVVVRPGVARVRRRVSIGDGPGLDELRQAVATGGRDGKGSPYVEAVGLDDFPELSVVIDGGHYVLRDAQDQPLPRITPPVAVGGDAAARQVLQRLEHVVQNRNAWDLHNGDAASTLSDQLAISVVRETAGTRSAGRVALQPGEVILCRLHNRSGRPLSAALLYFGPDWSVQRIWPSAVAYTELAPTDEQGFDAIRLGAKLPTGVTSSQERLKLFATDRPTSFDALELGSLDTVRGATRGLPRNALEQLLADVGDARATRELVVVGSTGDWGTAELELETRA